MGFANLLDPEALLSPASFISDLGLVNDAIYESIPLPRRALKAHQIF